MPESKTARLARYRKLWHPDYTPPPPRKPRTPSQQKLDEIARDVFRSFHPDAPPMTTKPTTPA